MSLDPVLLEKREAILSSWRRAILDTYPPEAAKLFGHQKDRFRNPIGAKVVEGTAAVFDGLLENADREELARRCDGIVRLRAVQDFLPSEAVSFPILLKKVVREHLHGEDVDPEELDSFLGRVDSLSLVAFDVYVACRERIYELRAKDAWNRSFKLLERAGFVEEIPDGRDSLLDGYDSSAERGADR